MVVTWIIEDELAVSPMPSASALSDLARVFDAVLAVVEPYELWYDPDEWGRLNAAFKLLPVPDFQAPHLLDLYHAVRWARERVAEEGKVLVHCLGGRGRSGVVAAYLVYAKGLSWEEAVRRVRSRVRRAIETPSQFEVLVLLDTLLDVLPEPKLNVVDEVASAYDYSRGLSHASKVLELSLRLWRQLGKALGLTRLHGGVLAAAAILHDVGVHVSPVDHHEHTLTIIREREGELLTALSGWELEAVAWTAYHHRSRAGDPLHDPRIPEGLRGHVARVAALLRVADALDHTLDQRVEDIEAYVEGDELRILAYSSRRCDVNLDRARAKSGLLTGILGVEARFEEAPATL